MREQVGEWVHVVGIAGGFIQHYPYILNSWENKKRFPQF